MLLAEWFHLYVRRQLDLRPTTVAAYKFAVNKFIRWTIDTYGSAPLTTDLSVDLISDWLTFLTEAERLKPRSVNSYRSSINAVWHGAMVAKLAPMSDSRCVPSCRIPRTIPIAWELEDVAKLIEAAKLKKGRRKNKWNTLRRDFWLGLYLFLYDTGTRFGAALELEAKDVNLRRLVVLLRAEVAKTKTDQLVSISPETGEVMGRLISDGHDLVWPNGANRQQLYEEHKRTLQHVGLPFDRYHMFHCFRKTTATQIAINSSVENASRVLGHSSVTLTKRVYIDARQMPVQRISSILPRPCIDPDDDGERNVLTFGKMA